MDQQQRSAQGITVKGRKSNLMPFIFSAQVFTLHTVCLLLTPISLIHRYYLIICTHCAWVKLICPLLQGKMPTIS